MFDFFRRKPPPPSPQSEPDVPPADVATTAAGATPAVADRVPTPGDVVRSEAERRPVDPSPSAASPWPGQVLDEPAASPAAGDGVLAAPPASAEPADAPKASWRDRLKAGLGLSRERLAGALTGVFRRRTLDDEALVDLEAALLQADVGIDATAHLIDDLPERYRRAGPDADPRGVLRDAMVDLLAPLERPLTVTSARPYVIMIAGVNGAGKTTSIGKLAKWLRSQNLSVLLAAGDTFRAAAREQLVAWGERNGIAVVQQQGGDPAAVIFDAIGAARARNIDVVIADTAGRLPTQGHLMEELRKIRRVIAKARDGAPDAVLLVLDANTGQNGLTQVKAFDAAIGLTGLVVTKLDGTAKGGVIAAIAKQHPIPLQFIGVGEGVDDLRPFSAREFVEALLPGDEVQGRVAA
jgi:fused signal recognition particle receptor